MHVDLDEVHRLDFFLAQQGIQRPRFHLHLWAFLIRGVEAVVTAVVGRNVQGQHGVRIGSGHWKSLHIANCIGGDGLLEITKAIGIRFHGEDASIGTDRACGEGGVVAEIGAHIEEGHTVTAGGLKKKRLCFFIHAETQRTTDDGIGGVEHHRGPMNFNLLG